MTEKPSNPFIAGLTAAGLLLVLVGIVTWTQSVTDSGEIIGALVGLAGVVLVGLAGFAGALQWQKTQDRTAERDAAAQ